MKRNHALSEKLPLLSMLLAVAAAFLVCGLAASFSSSDFVQYLLISAAGILCMLAQRWWFAPAFKGVFRTEIPLREIGLLCVPFLLQLLLDECCGALADPPGCQGKDRSGLAEEVGFC